MVWPGIEYDCLLIANYILIAIYRSWPIPISSFTQLSKLFFDILDQRTASEGLDMKLSIVHVLANVQITLW